MAVEAASTSRNSFSDASSPLAAIAPMFQTTPRCASRLVVATNRRRPALCPPPFLTWFRFVLAGMGEQPDYPTGYLEQLAKPFRGSEA